MLGSTATDELGSDVRLAVLTLLVTEDTTEVAGKLDPDAIELSAIGADAVGPLGVSGAAAVGPAGVTGADTVGMVGVTEADTVGTVAVTGANAVGTVGVAGAGAERVVDSCNNADVACGVSSDCAIPEDWVAKLDFARSGLAAVAAEDEPAGDPVAAASSMSSRGNSPNGNSA